MLFGAKLPPQEEEPPQPVKPAEPEKSTPAVPVIATKPDAEKEPDAAPEKPAVPMPAMVFAEDEDDALNQLEEQLKEQGIAHGMCMAEEV